MNRLYYLLIFFFLNSYGQVYEYSRSHTVFDGVGEGNISNYFEIRKDEGLNFLSSKTSSMVKKVVNNKVEYKSDNRKFKTVLTAHKSKKGFADLKLFSKAHLYRYNKDLKVYQFSGMNEKGEIIRCDSAPESKLLYCKSLSENICRNVFNFKDKLKSFFSNEKCKKIIEDLSEYQKINAKEARKMALGQFKKAILTGHEQFSDKKISSNDLSFVPENGVDYSTLEEESIELMSSLKDQVINCNHFFPKIKNEVNLSLENSSLKSSEK